MMTRAAIGANAPGDVQSSGENPWSSSPGVATARNDSIGTLANSTYLSTHCSMKPNISYFMPRVVVVAWVAPGPADVLAVAAARVAPGTGDAFASEVVGSATVARGSFDVGTSFVIVRSSAGFNNGAVAASRGAKSCFDTWHSECPHPKYLPIGVGSSILMTFLMASQPSLRFS